MAKKKTLIIDDSELLVRKLRQRFKRNYLDLFGDNDRWDYSYIQNNLKDKLRPYQEETLFFFHDCQSNSKTELNFRHLMFNLATGAGKTMLMAATMLYLFKEKGFQNFLFFVHTDGILQKTIDNLVNTGSSKYLFTQVIEIDGRDIKIEQVDVFPKTPNDNTIYLKLATINKVHLDLNIQKENAITFEDLQDIPLVMLADEAHHYNAATASTKKEKEDAGKWERTIEKLLNINNCNRLLEFTATIDLSNEDLFNKYKDKIVQRYDLRKFMEDGFSKKVMLLQVNQDDKTKMLDAILLSQYRKLIASKNGILSFKPVIMFKSNQIDVSIDKHEEFNQVINDLTVEQITNHLQDKQKVLSDKPASIWHKVAKFYGELDLQDVLLGIKKDFNELNIINANGKEMIDESNAKILNTLEDANNPFRVVFAVAKLNEGWDVLNLFDIVRISEKAVSTSASTNQEAQLIGRGARYFPFFYKNEKLGKRRFDNQNTELAILEQLHYHTINETSYINNLNNSITQTRLLTSLDGSEQVFTVKVKESFKKTLAYQEGKLYRNRTKSVSPKERTLYSYTDKDIFLSYKIADESLLSEIQNLNLANFKSKSVKVETLKAGRSYFRKAIQRLKFYQFSNLKRYFPVLNSIDEFIMDYLSSIRVQVTIPEGLNLSELTPKERLNLLEEALAKIAINITKNYQKATGTKVFYGTALNEIVKDYEIKVEDSTDNISQKITAKNMIGKKWFVYDNAVLNQLEHQMLSDMHEVISKLEVKYRDVYLIRNDERSSSFKLTEFDGVRGFMPDFILILSNDNEQTFYQVILEPKGEPYYLQDKWKENMLEQMNGEDIIIEESDRVRLVGVKFYRQFNDGTTDFTQEFFDDLAKKIFDGKSLIESKSTLIDDKQGLLFD
ncbi:hypothetical protein QV08_10375 [Gallibacterium salpingitidis]|uniref:DEAD/DEAH box helicase family protein n=1 Tax=Gallibacterium salpingitidis TaxID=505341 RepID=UPI000805C625|nr:DEAD/DEAH box helicase family protein [Gallibacterium salpingitidis]OBX06381.1 hypothetical protein QV08_10375 [Gallibacterium salpingitidis]